MTRAAPVDSRSKTTLETGIAVADDDGIGAVTLRSVAGRAGLALTAVQRDFGSRDRLVAMMVQHALSRRARASARTEDPVETLTRLAEDEWRAYQSHPWLVGVLASTRPPLVPAVLDASRAAVEVFLKMGLDSDAALNRYLAFSAYIQGMGLLLVAERRESGRSGTSYRTWWRQEVRRLDRTGAMLRHTWLVELANQPPADAFDASVSFRDGLHRVVWGLVQW